MSLQEEDITKQFTFKAICFSTDYKNMNSISVMKQYFMSTECLDVVYTNNNNQVDFIHKISGENDVKILCKSTYTEIYPLSKNNKINDVTDCYIIFFDLENEESMAELNKILKFLSNFGDSSKKLYVINIYTNEKNIKGISNEENIKGFLVKYGLINYDIYDMNIDSSNEIVKVIDTLTEEILEEKKKSDMNDYRNNDKSKSLCFII